MPPIRQETYATAAELERTCVEGALGGSLVLAGRGRLARRLLHRCRMARIATGTGAWESPLVFGLARWVREVHQLLWVERRPPAPADVLALWHRACLREPPPEGVPPGPGLCLMLQDAFDRMERYGIPAVAEAEGYALPAWRARVTRAFLTSIPRQGFAPWGAVIGTVTRAVRNGKVDLPGRIAAVCFDDPSPHEADLLEAFSDRAELSLLSISAERAGHRIRVYPTPDQECAAVAAEAVEAWNRGERDLAVVFLDDAYRPRLASCFEDLAAREKRPEGALRYNLTMGTPLAEHPLYRTAMLPLRIVSERRPGSLAASWLASPYQPEPGAHWSREDLERLFAPPSRQRLRPLLGALGENRPAVRAFEDISDGRPRSLSSWIDALRRIWKAFGFPRLGSEALAETDLAARDHLEDVLRGLSRSAGAVNVTASGALEWIEAVAEHLQVIAKTPETAGIQVLPAREAPGLSFGRAWIVGCHGGVLPGSLPDLPFLSPAERSACDTLSPEGRWRDSTRILTVLTASAPRVTLCRAYQAEDDTPYPPCPLLPDESGEGGRTVDLWKDPPRPWHRALWIRGGFEGLSSPAPEAPDDAVGAAPPVEMRATWGLPDLMQCPFRYLCGHVLGLEPLPDEPGGVSPRERGIVVHGILQSFLKPFAGRKPWDETEPDARARLAEITDAAVGARARASGLEPAWRAERTRLLGTGEHPGVLTAWLEAEFERRDAGWTFRAAEKSFERVPLADTGLLLTGRADRLDRLPDGGLMIWDYKTGAVPSRRDLLRHWAYPQLFAYAASLSHWPEDDPEAPVQAGYISLRHAADLRFRPVEDKELGADMRPLLPRWIEAVKDRLAGPMAGRYPADPRPPYSSGFSAGACAYCPYGNLCGHFDELPEKGENP